MYGPDSFPLEWPVTVAHLITLASPDDVLVPGHGCAVGVSFAQEQHDQLAAVATLIRELHADGVPASRAAAAGGRRWPLPADGLAPAVEVGYAQLSRADREDGGDPGHCGERQGSPDRLEHDRAGGGERGEPNPGDPGHRGSVDREIA